jgi:hypothetical protein
MTPVNRFEHFVKYCEFQGPQALTFFCQYDLTVEVIFDDESAYDASWYWKQQMGTSVNVSALLKRDFDRTNETNGTRLSGDWPSEKADREKTLAQLLSAAFERDMAIRGLKVHSFEVRVEITEMTERL